MFEFDEMFTNPEARKSFRQIYDHEIKVLLQMGSTEAALSHKRNLKRMMMEFSAFDH